MSSIPSLQKFILKKCLKVMRHFHLATFLICNAKMLSHKHDGCLLVYISVLFFAVPVPFVQCVHVPHFIACTAQRLNNLLSFCDRNSGVVFSLHHKNWDRNLRDMRGFSRIEVGNCLCFAPDNFSNKMRHC